MSVERLNSTDSRVEVFKKVNEAIARTDDATAESFGTLRVASSADETNCSCNNAAITPSNFYNLNNFRKANTGYVVGDTVAVPYHHNLQLKCTIAGITDTGMLDTSVNLTEGQIITDGTVVWEVKKVGDVNWGKIQGNIEAQADLKEALESKQDVLIAGDNVIIEDNVISAYSGHDLFDIVQKDHILSYEETQGYELLGNYVYKTAVLGSRYGYPDFYNKVVEEYNASTSKHFKKYKSSNVTNSRLADKSGVLSGFTTSYYASNAFVSVSKMELVAKFTMGEDNTTQQAIVGSDVQYDGITMYLLNGYLTVYISSNGTSWNVASKIAGTHLFSPNKTYLVKYKYIDTGYHKFYISEDDGQTWTEDISISSTNLVFSGYHNLGIGDTKDYPFLGTIDLNGCYLIDISSNGMYNWQGCNYYEFDYVEHENGHKFYDIANKDAVDELFNSCGMAWFYGVDTANERVYLPRNVWFEQSTSDISEVGASADAGLPNIEGNAYHLMAASNNFTGPFKYTTDNANIKMGTNAAAVGRNFDFDASLANPIYGNSDSVQPNAVKKLAYMVVGNTPVESAVTDVVDVTTSENDTLPLLHHIPSDELLGHPSWLRSTGEWNDGNVYTSAYNYLVNEYRTGSEHTDTLKIPDGTEYTVIYRTVKGKKVVDVANIDQVTAVYSAIGSAWYYVIDQENMLFRLPQSHNFECYTADPTRLGLDISAGLPNITGSSAISGVKSGEGSGAFVNKGSGDLVDYSSSGGAGSINGTITLDASNSNPIYGNSDTVTPPHTEFYLYFKVANAVQNLQLLDVGEVLEAVSRKVNINSDVIDGQWNVVSDYPYIFTATAVGDYTLDISDYLPNDNYVYEVMLRCYGYNSSATDKRVWVGTDLMPIIDTGEASMAPFGVLVDSDRTKYIVNTINFVTLNRTVFVRIFGGALNEANVRLFAYRRIGTNQ